MTRPALATHLLVEETQLLEAESLTGLSDDLVRGEDLQAVKLGVLVEVVGVLAAQNRVQVHSWHIVWRVFEYEN